MSYLVKLFIVVIGDTSQNKFIEIASNSRVQSASKDDEAIRLIEKFCFC